ncbi:hypothetical protein [Thalassospira lucentensis]|uniref:hypothetical protein n=1 Tax=Thalassospira lucentensis TaxID=168935 RepID=UPI00142DC75A|nr:hypothetical protein [Thalassospira lucentensis]NIZ03753.1 hypothetical protein [Thalassospira lucentensis]
MACILAAFAQAPDAAHAVDGMANVARASMVPPAISDDVVLNPKDPKTISPWWR